MVLCFYTPCPLLNYKIEIQWFIEMSEEMYMEFIHGILGHLI